MSAKDALGRQFHTEHDDKGDSGYIDAFDKPGGKNLGSLSYWHMSGRERSLGVDDLNVQPDAQRKGVATSMYDHLLRDKPGHVIVHDVPNMSGEGQALADRLKKRHPGRHKFEELK